MAKASGSTRKTGVARPSFDEYNKIVSRISSMVMDEGEYSLGKGYTVKSKPFTESGVDEDSGRWKFSSYYYVELHKKGKMVDWLAIDRASFEVSTIYDRWSERFGINFGKMKKK